MSPELIASLAAGVGLAQPEGLPEGPREAVTGRRVPGDAA